MTWTCQLSHMYGVMIKQCRCHVINVRNYAIMQTLYDINGWVYLQYIFRNPTVPPSPYIQDTSALSVSIN